MTDVLHMTDMSAVTDVSDVTSQEVTQLIKVSSSISNGQSDIDQRQRVLSAHHINHTLRVKDKICPLLKTQKQILFDVSSIFRRGVSAIMGPTGSGKTTLLDILAGRTTPDRGATLLLDGHDVPSNFRFLVGYVVQKTKDDDSTDVKKNKPSTENVDRVRRCHRNDLENVIPFVLLGLLYVATGPAYETARIHFRIFTISRFFHTVFYIFAIPQPSRAMVFFAGLGINISMAYRILTQALF